MEKRTLQNTAVIVAAVGAALAAIYANTDWLSKDSIVVRERCYGIARAAKNDCGTANHSCAFQAKKDGLPDEYIMVPKGLCDRITGGQVE